MAGKYIENYFYSRTFPKIVNRKIIFFFQEQYLPLCIVNNLSYVASVWNWLKRLNLATVRDNFEQPVNLVSDPVWQFFYILFSNDDCWQVNKINTFKHLANSIAETKIKNKKLPATKKSQINSFLLGYHWFVQNKTKQNKYLFVLQVWWQLPLSLGTNPSWVLKYATENKEMSMFSPRKIWLFQLIRLIRGKT